VGLNVGSGKTLAVAGTLTVTGASTINNTSIGASTASTGAFTTLAYTGTLTGGTGVINIGSGQLYKDASGNVGIGTSSPGSKFDVVGGRSTFAANSENFSVYLRYNSSTSGFYIGSPSADAMAFSASSGAERMRIDSAGNVGIGTSSPARKFHVSGSSTVAQIESSTTGVFLELKNSGGNAAYVGSTSGSNLVVETGGSERMRIDSSGNLLVGTTGIAISGYAASRTQVNTGGNSQGIVLDNISGSGGYVGIITRPDSTTTYDAARFLNSSSSVVGSISVSTVSTLYNTTSDQRLKENIQDAAPASSLIDSLQVRQYNWKSDGTHQRYGFVAQELLTVAPEAVHQPADPEAMMAVDYSKLVPMLVKEIQSLRQRLAAAGI
jgi:hypothetical protein